MIVLDSSAILAVLFEEAASEAILDCLDGASRVSVSAANVLECAIRLAPERGLDDSAVLDEFLDLYAVAIVPVDIVQLKLAREAFLAFGKGRHRARLNYGDCFAYALARALDAPLVFIGNHFSETDIRPALT